MSDKQDGHASAAAQEADAVGEVTRDTKSQTSRFNKLVSRDAD
jgi:hypothetical protein